MRQRPYAQNQAFCCDEQNRLVWAGTSGTVPCTNAASPSEGIGGAGYIATYGYDNLDRITGASVLDGSGTPLADAAQGGPFEYGSGARNGDAPLHGVTGVGIPGQQMTYDTLCRLLVWQNTPSSMAASGAAYLCGDRARAARRPQGDEARDVNGSGLGVSRIEAGWKSRA